jgi:hypothetical protein
VSETVRFQFNNILQEARYALLAGQHGKVHDLLLQAASINDALANKKAPAQTGA